jgi:hypothetical protein
LTYDLRGVGLTDALLQRISACGAPTLFITEAQASALQPRITQIPSLHLSYIVDKFTELTRGCPEKLGPQALRRAMDSCMALLSAGTNWGINRKVISNGR